MNEIICPKCNKAFKIDEAGYADILKQVRNHEFDQEIRDKLAAAEKDKENAVELAEEKTKNKMQADVVKIEKQFTELKTDKEAEISTLQAKLDSTETEKKLELTEAVSAVEKERDELKIKLASQENEKILIKQGFETQLKDRDDSIERLKDMKAKQSTKLIGESLEQHCQNEFNKHRSTAFPNAYFEKDNDTSSGSKGDYIFRDPAEGVESVSIMFDMKNESDTTETKKKNEDFLAKLDKDRTEKGCEYAILVSLLEADNDFYNQGVADMSFRYPKMYVIRPQFFIPMIGILKNSAEKSLVVKNELAIIKSQNIDITTFEEDVNAWKSGWLTTMKNAGKKHIEAVEQINKTIKNLEGVRDALTMSNKHLLAAENKMDDLTIKRLTRKNPTMAAKFAEISMKEEPSSKNVV